MQTCLRSHTLALPLSYMVGRDDVGTCSPRGIRTCAHLHTYTTQLPPMPQTAPQHPMLASLHNSMRTPTYTHSTIIHPVNVLYMSTWTYACSVTWIHDIHMQMQTARNIFRMFHLILLFSSTCTLQRAHPTSVPGTVQPCTPSAFLPALTSSPWDFTLSEGRDPVFFQIPHSALPRASSSFVRSLIQNLLVCTIVHLNAEHSNLSEL